MTVKHTLKTSARDNHGISYPVTISEVRGRLVFGFGSAPAGWAVGSLRDYCENQLAMDLGQGWYCVNIQEVLAEAFKTV